MRFLVLIFFIFCSFCCLAQQTSQYSMYMMNRYLYNPAFAGFEDYLDVKSGFRQQWTGLNTNFSNFYITANMAFDKSDRTSSGATPYMSKTIRRAFNPTRTRDRNILPNFHQGVGIQLMGDQLGPFNSLSMGLTYAYHMPLGGEKKLAFGATVGFSQYTLNFSDFTQWSQDNLSGNYRDMDSYIINGKLVGSRPLINFGVMYYNRTFYMGGSVNQLILDNFGFSKSSVAASDTNRTIWLGTSAPNAFVQAGFRKKIGEFYNISPSFLIKYMRNASLVYEGNLKFDYGEAIWAGVSYRHKEAIGAFLGAQISPKMNVTYSYEIHSLGLSRSSMGSHELVLGFMFNNKTY